MKILLIGNFTFLKSESMNRYADMIVNGLKDNGYQVRLIKPKPIISRIMPSTDGFGKWLGYFDRFLFFRCALKKAVSWADIIHICDQANAVYFPLINGKPSVITCHDLISIRSALGEFAIHKTKFIGRIYQRWILTELKNFKFLLCVSKTTYDDALRLLGSNHKVFFWVKNGLNYPYRRMCKKKSLILLSQLNLIDKQPFFLHVGGNYWYKNKRGLLNIFGEITRFDRFKNYRLFLVGDSLDKKLRTLSERIGISKQIIEIGKITNEHLCALYSLADGLIFPSLVEGFGWPIIEAQACGCPVFTSNLKPMNEVGGDAAIYFDPTQPKSAAHTIMKSMSQKQSIQKLGYINVGEYSCDRMIKDYINFYRLCVSN